MWTSNVVCLLRLRKSPMRLRALPMQLVVMFLSELIIIIRLLAQRLITINVLPFKIRLVKFLLH